MTFILSNMFKYYNTIVKPVAGVATDLTLNYSNFAPVNVWNFAPLHVYILCYAKFCPLKCFEQCIYCQETPRLIGNSRLAQARAGVLENT